MPEEPNQDWSFERGLAELEATVKELESGELPLEKAITIFERGVVLSERCRKELEEAETRVEILLQRNGTMTPQSFEPTKE